MLAFVSPERFCFDDGPDCKLESAMAIPYDQSRPNLQITLLDPKNNTPVHLSGLVVFSTIIEYAIWKRWALAFALTTNLAMHAITTVFLVLSL